MQENLPGERNGKTSISVDQDQLICPVCLVLLKDPVTIPCGHSYCMSCISDCWDQEDQKGIYRCPLCKQTFTPRPVLGKNVVFAEIMEKLKKTRLQAAAPAVPHTGSEDVPCDSCSGRKQKAVKSCLECRRSYCQNHLEQHESLFRGNRHNLMDATGRLQEMICSRHDKLLEIYCRTDQRCICVLCLVDEHKSHDTVSTTAARTEKQSHFEETQITTQKRIQQREKDLQALREAVASHKRSAQTAVQDSERIFTELIRSMERRRSEVTQLIRDQERAAVSRAEERLERLEQEIEDLRRRDAELKQLSHTHDHVHFLQSLSSVSLSGSTDGFTVSSRLSFDDVVKSVSQLRDKLQQFCSEETEKISGRVKAVQVILAPEYQTREEFLQYSHPEVCTEEPPFPPLFKTPSIKRAPAKCTRTYRTPVGLSQPCVSKPTPTPVNISQPSWPRPTPVSISQPSWPRPTPVSISQPSWPRPTPVSISQPSWPRPTPMSISQQSVPQLTPMSISQPFVPRPTPMSISQQSVPQPTPLSISQPFVPRPTPMSISQPFVPRPTPMSISQPFVPQPTPLSISQPFVPRPTPLSISQPFVPRPTPLSISQPFVPRPTPMSISQPRVPRPTPMSISQPFVPQPTPLSISQPFVPRPTPMSISQPRVPRPTPMSILQPSVPKPTPMSILQPSVPRPTPGSIYQPSVPKPTPMSIFEPSMPKPTPSSISQPRVPRPNPMSILQPSVPRPTSMSILQPSVPRPTP